MEAAVPLVTLLSKMKRIETAINLLT
jgi:hypothetical protein